MATESVGSTHDAANAANGLPAVGSPAPIVVATDLSPTSTEALVAADVRSRASGAPLIVCHVLPDEGDSAAEDRSVLAEGMDRVAAERRLRSQVRSATGRAPDGYSMHIGHGLVSRSIAELADASLAGLIVIGRGSAENMPSAWSSRTSSQLARRSRASLMVVLNGRRRGLVVAPDGGSVRAARIAEAEAARRDVLVVGCDGDAVATAKNRFASLIVIDDTTGEGDPADVVRRAPCSVLVVRGDVAF